MTDKKVSWKYLSGLVIANKDWFQFETQKQIIWIPHMVHELKTSIAQ